MIRIGKANFSKPLFAITKGEEMLLKNYYKLPRTLRSTAAGNDEEIITFTASCRTNSLPSPSLEPVTTQVLY